MMKTRKTRVDRNHAIYSLSCNGQLYIGLTHVSRRDPEHSVKRRFRKHVQRALAEDKSWKLCVAIRENGAESFKVRVLKVVRGKTLARTEEKRIIARRQPSLNSDVR